jgi:hypothetical protein
VKTLTFYAVNLTTVGCTTFERSNQPLTEARSLEYAKYWTASNLSIGQLDYQPTGPEAASTVVRMSDGRTFLSNELIQALGIAAEGPQLRIGRRTWHQFNAATCEWAMKQATYPARNDNEQAVSNRNLALVEWLMDQTTF